MTQQNRIDNIYSIINNITSDAGYNINDDIKYQMKYMDSNTYNNDIDAIYNAINRLYEKTRLLYDLSENVESYIFEYINGTLSDFESIIKRIEIQRDSLKYNTDIIYNVDFENDYDSEYTDRDNSIIDKKAYIRGGTLTLNPIVTINISLTDNDIHISQYDKSCLYNSINQLSANGIYRAYYATTSPTTIKEKVTITFDHPVRMNDFDLKLSNCTYDNLTYITDDSNKIAINQVSTILPTKQISSIEFDIICDSPNIDTFTLESTESPDYYYELKKKDFYSQVQQYKNDISTYDELVYKYTGIDSGFYNDDQSLIKHANDPDQYQDKSGIYKFGNPYPKIETANIYGTKEI